MKTQLVRTVYVRLTIAIAIILLAVIFIVARQAKQKLETPHEHLNVLNWTSYIPDEVITNFEQQTGIKVNYGTYSSNEELLAKVNASAPGTYDLIFPPDYMVDLMLHRNLLEPIDAAKLTELANLDSRFLGQSFDPQNQYSYPFLLATTVIAYDASKLDLITSYRDLLRPELANNIIMLDDQRVVIGAMLNAAGYSANSTNDFHLSESLAFFDLLRPNIKAFDSDSPKTFFITDEVDAGLVWNAEAILAKAERPSLKITYPTEGFSLSMDNYCLVKGSKNQANAYQFINYLMQPEIAAQIVAEYPYISPISSVETVPSAELDEIFARGTYIENVGADISKFDKLWIKYK